MSDAVAALLVVVRCILELNVNSVTLPMWFYWGPIEQQKVGAWIEITANSKHLNAVEHVCSTRECFLPGSITIYFCVRMDLKGPLYHRAEKVAELLYITIRLYRSL